MPKLSLTLPQDVLDILKGINKSPADAITSLARGYSSMMDDATGAASGEIISFGSTQQDDGELPEERGTPPSREEIEFALQQHTQPNASLDSLIIQHHDTTTPRGPSGLVPMEYILASGGALVADLLAWDEKEYEIRAQAIQEILSKTPEDAWSGIGTAAAVDVRYKEILEKVSK